MRCVTGHAAGGGQRKSIEKQVDLMLMVVEVKILLVGVSFFFFTQHHNSGFTTPHSSRISAIRKCMRKVRISFSCVGIPKFCYVKYHLLFNPFPFPFAVNSFSNGPFLLWWFTETSECKLKGVFIMLLYFLQLRQSLILHKKNQLKENLSLRLQFASTWQHSFEKIACSWRSENTDEARDGLRNESVFCATRPKPRSLFSLYRYYCMVDCFSPFY